MQELKNLPKRIYAYVRKPAYFGAECPECNGLCLEWSEYARHVWCFDCSIDFKWTIGIVGMSASALMNVDYSLYSLETGEIEYCHYSIVEGLRGNNIELVWNSNPLPDFPVMEPSPDLRFIIQKSFQREQIVLDYYRKVQNAH